MPGVDEDSLIFFGLPSARPNVYSYIYIYANSK
jgi:hypothetical protein